MGMCQIARGTVPYYQALEKLFKLKTQKSEEAIRMCVFR